MKSFVYSCEVSWLPFHSQSEHLFEQPHPSHNICMNLIIFLGPNEQILIIVHIETSKERFVSPMKLKSFLRVNCIVCV